MKKLNTMCMVLAVLLIAASGMVSAAGFVEPPTEWDETYDVVVIGAGFAGLAASERAAALGASTVLIDRMPFVGGNSVINGGVYASYTSAKADEWYEALGLEPDTFDKHVEDSIAGGDGFPRRELVEQWVAGAPHFLNMMIENGLELRQSITMPGGHYGFRTYTTANQSGSDIVIVQQRMAQEAGVDIRLETNMTYIYREAPMAGRVLGVRVEQGDSVINIKADKAVILATGGFGGDIEMRQRHVPWIDASTPTTNHRGAAGDGLQLAQLVGANTIHMAFVQLYPFANPDNGVLDPIAVVPFSGPSGGIVYVDAEGRRYVNEGERRDINSLAAIATGMYPTFSIFSDDMYGSFTTAADLERAIARGRVLVADTLEELAAEISAHTYAGNEVNMSGEVLAQTIARHNEFVVQGNDSDFGKVITPGTTLPMLEGPYYAIPQWPSVHHTMGGVEINVRAEVLDIYGDVIPGLLAAGEVTGGVHGSNRLGSNAIPDAAVFGLIAGEVAVNGEPPVFEIFR